MTGTVARWAITRTPWWWHSDSCTHTGPAGPAAARAFAVQLAYAASAHGRQHARWWPTDPCVAPPDIIAVIEGTRP